MRIGGGWEVGIKTERNQGKAPPNYPPSYFSRRGFLCGGGVEGGGGVEVGSNPPPPWLVSVGV